MRGLRGASTKIFWSELPAESAALLDLGQNYAFGLIAGRWSAAQAAGLRRLREEKLYKRCAENWSDFCPQYPKMSRSEVDRGLWQEADVAVRTERLNECSAAVVAEFEKISREEGLGLAREI